MFVRNPKTGEVGDTREMLKDAQEKLSKIRTEDGAALKIWWKTLESQNKITFDFWQKTLKDLVE